MFDSGVGGLTVARSVLDQLPHEQVLYIGDTANSPYGPRDIAEVFGVGKSKSYEICAALPHIYVGRNIRVHRLTVLQELREKGCLP